MSSKSTSATRNPVLKKESSMFEHMKHYQSRNLGAREGITGWDVLGVGVAEAIEWVCLPRERRSLGSW